MKRYYYIAIALISLTSCAKEQATPYVSGAFDQELTVRFLQDAFLPAASAPEISIRVNDVTDARCPANADCVAPGAALVELSIRGQRFESQTVYLTRTGGAIDSTIVQANGFQYTVFLDDVIPYPVSFENDPKGSKQVIMRVSKR